MTSIGIDLGTTNSVLSRIEGGRPMAVPVDGSPIFPSVVLFDGERVIAGREARNLELLHPDRTIRSVKRKMGTDHRFVMGDRVLSPEEVSAEILRAICAAASAQLGEPVSDVVITVPAYFDDAQRRATLRAGELAGLQVLRLLNEPTSASLCYERIGPAQDVETVLIYDLGGGTFDVSVLEVVDGVREVRSTAGNTRLGGDDFDDKLLAHLVDHVKRLHGVDPREDLRAMVRLRRIAEETKIGLSTDTRVPVQEEFLTTASGTPVHLDLEVTRRDFEKMIRPLLESTIALARRALDDAKIDRPSLSRVCLVGGSTRIPMVRCLLREAFDVAIHEEIDPDLAVGMGAAVQAAMLRGEPVDRVLVDVAAHSLGIRVLGEEDGTFGEADTFAPVLARNTVLPASRAEEFYTVVDRQEQLRVEVLQGERASASQNTRVGDFLCDLDPAPAKSPVRVEFAYDLDGVVRVSVSQPGHPGVKTVALSVADSTRATGGAPATAGAVERRALALREELEPAAQDELDRLLDRLRAIPSAERDAAEDAVLDFLIEHEPADDGDDPEEQD
jgi:molecular chaperone DnaK